MQSRHNRLHHAPRPASHAAFGSRSDDQRRSVRADHAGSAVGRVCAARSGAAETRRAGDRTRPGCVCGIRPRYKEVLRRKGIEVELRETLGAAENLYLLRDPSQRIDLAFVQGGAGEAIYAVDEDRSGAPLVSLGSLFYEPVWIFYRTDAKIAASTAASAVNTGPAAANPAPPKGGADKARQLTHLGQLAGLRVNLGPPGSGARNLMLKLLHANRVEPGALQVAELSPSLAVAAMLNGELDVIALVSAPESPLVQCCC